ncbi:MAG: acyl-ACP--UDP-N-acetylglucosamine O-acyltransferase [Candidatus Omnitrophica bacterium]|nr:acyl-ACP--UDP-N-acetylglucosamine O-acyltransferase [Candidatus Omnitrophota bacterium]
MNVETEKTVIHPTAIVHPSAELGPGVEVGPYSIIEGTVRIGAGTKIGPRVTVEGHTTVGAQCEIFTGAVVGSVTQDKKFKGGKCFLVIGNRNKIREYVTINPGTAEGTETRIGDDNLIMAYAHIAHDCVVGNQTTLANNATLGGHVSIEDRAIIGGLSAVHQFVRIGSLSIVGGCSKVVQDIPPYMMVDGHPAKAYGLNAVGLERADFPSEERLLLKRAFKIVFRSRLTVKSAVAQLESELPPSPAVLSLIEFLKKSERGICK